MEKVATTTTKQRLGLCFLNDYYEVWGKGDDGVTIWDYDPSFEIWNGVNYKQTLDTNPPNNNCPRCLKYFANLITNMHLSYLCAMRYAKAVCDQLKNWD
jgi:hypothetical protein